MAWPPEPRQGTPRQPSRLWGPLRPTPRAAFSETLADLGPVHDVPPCGDVIDAAILVLQVVGMLPDIQPENRRFAFHDRVVLIRSALDAELAVGVDQPGPSAAKASDARLGKLLLERAEPTEGRLHRLGERAFGFASGVGSHDL